MSSPPPPGGAASPPGSSFALPNPRKRPSISTSSSMIKRRKPSFAGSATSSNHPLRQTSFPPEPGSAVDESRQSSFSPSVISQGRSSLAGAAAPKKRGRKPKNAAAGDESKSATGSTRNRDGGGKGGAGDDDDEDDDDEGEGQADAVLEGGERGQMTESARRLEREHMLMLMNAFDAEQFERYEIWRRVRLKKETVRKIVNQTLSQSVPASVVTTVMSSTKIFIGELVESAREVQSEWAACAEVLPSGERNARFAAATNGRANGEAAVKMEGEDDGHANGTTSKVADVKERDKGPLLPDHLREALRRYKRDREGGSVGFQGLSLHGVEGTSSRTGGRRLFR